MTFIKKIINNKRKETSSWKGKNISKMWSTVGSRENVILNQILKVMK